MVICKYNSSFWLPLQSCNSTRKLLGTVTNYSYRVFKHGHMTENIGVGKA